MKKNIKNITRKLLCLFAFVFSLISCKEVVEDGNKPALNVKGDSIIVSFAVDEKAKYVNIFRREVDLTGDEPVYGKVINIGQVIPKKNQETAFTFEDSLIFKGADYQYCVRYCMGNYYYLSNWSDIKSNDDLGYNNEAEITPDVGSCYLQYNSATSSLTLKGGDIDALRGFPALVFSYKDKETTVSKVFALPQQELDPSLQRILKEETVIDLRSLLTTDFFSKEVTLNAFIGEEVLEGGTDINDPDKKVVYYEKVFWTLPAAIEVKDGNGIVESIKIDINNADNGHDYSFEGIEGSILANVNSITSKSTSKEYFITK